MRKMFSIPLFMLGSIVILFSVLELYSNFIELKYLEYHLPVAVEASSSLLYMLVLSSLGIYLLWIGMFSQNKLQIFKRKSLYGIFTLVLVALLFETTADRIAPSDEFLAQEALQLYRNGDYQAALTAFQNLESNNLVALAMMGKMYGKGYGVEVDYQKALELLALPAEKDYSWAKTDLREFKRKLKKLKAQK